MISFVDSKAILSVGYELAGNAHGAALGILAVTAPIAFGVAMVRHSVGGRHPIFVLFQIVAVSFGLRYYSAITSVVSNIGAQAAKTIGKAGRFDQLIELYAKDADLKFKSDPAASPDQGSWDKAMDVIGAFGAGLLSGLLSVIGMLAVLVALNLYQILQAVLYGVLVAVGPIVIAVCVIPGAHAFFSRWLSALFELAMWPVIAAIIFEMIGASLMKLNSTATTAGSENFVTQFVANLAMVFCVCLIPKIAARLVGSGFGALGDMMQSSAMAPARAAATMAMGAAGAAIGRTLGASEQAIDAASAALNPAPLYQPPANGGPSGGLASGPTLGEREGMPPSVQNQPMQSRGPTSFDASDADTKRNLPAFDLEHKGGGQVGAAAAAAPPLVIGNIHQPHKRSDGPARHEGNRMKSAPPRPQVSSALKHRGES